MNWQAPIVVAVISSGNTLLLQTNKAQKALEFPNLVTKNRMGKYQLSWLSRAKIRIKYAATAEIRNDTTSVCLEPTFSSRTPPKM